jgi:glycerophosphoryl diester phosphodiesterase
MTESPLKQKLLNCSEGPFSTTDFALSHRGAALQFPEHTVQGRAAAARQGAGIIECDITFTKDRQLVCRHSQCDLHTSTNILAIPDLAAKCTQPFTPAHAGAPASALCCTSDLTLAEFKRLCGKQDGFNASATTPHDFLRGGTPDWRTELYDTCGTVTSHAEYIQQVNALGLSFTPETKIPLVPMPFQGDYTQAMFVQQAVDDYRAAGIHPSRVWFQSFQLADILYWLAHEPAFGAQAMYLQERIDDAPRDLAAQGVRIVAPALPLLLALDRATLRIGPSAYAVAARRAGLEIVTWSLERSGPLAGVAASKDYYYSSVLEGISADGQMYEVLDVLARQVGVMGVFADWPATVVYYANCMGLKGGFADAGRE